LKDQSAYNQLHRSTLREPDPGPVKVFDNLYFVGGTDVSSWAVNTSQGIILIDALYNPTEVHQVIFDGLKKLGLDPKNIKYVLLTHAHADHFGGAAEIQRAIPGVHVLLSAADWDYANVVVKQKAEGGETFEVPKHDMVATDGQKLTLGDETITMYLTPGHTPGTLSLIVPVKDHGKPLTLGMWGGRPFMNKAMSGEFMAQIKRFRGIMEKEHVAGRIGNHPEWDMSLDKLAKIKANPNGPNPYIESAADMKRFAQIEDLCLQNQLDWAK
jgi:metallo-beta-lactamase class B